MKLGSPRDCSDRQYAAIIQRPWTVLAFLPVILFLAGGIAFCTVAAEGEVQFYRHILVAILASIPAIGFLAIIWKKEKQRPYSLRVRRVAWIIMTVLISTMVIAAFGIVLFGEAKTEKKLAVLASLGMFAPTCIFFYQLLKNNPKAG